MTIGAIIMNTSGEWFAEVIAGMEKAGRDLGVKVQIVSSENDVATEADNMVPLLLESGCNCSLATNQSRWDRCRVRPAQLMPGNSVDATLEHILQLRPTPKVLVGVTIGELW
jgi:hypothetical protein